MSEHTPMPQEWLDRIIDHACSGWTAPTQVVAELIAEVVEGRKRIAVLEKQLRNLGCTEVPE